MTVKMLLFKLSKMPSEAEVVFPNMEIDQLEKVQRVELHEKSFVLPKYRFTVILR